MIKNTIVKRGLSLVLMSSLLGLTACEKKIGAEQEVAAASGSDIVLTTEDSGEESAAIAALGINANVLPSIEGVTIDAQAEDLAPVNLTVGVINSVVKDLQERLMQLGYMEDDDPTTYYGDATSKAVQYFQRQTGRTMDGITGVDTWDALMADNAPHYAAKLGFQGDDITKIQYRLYNLGYLTESGQINGNFDATTETAVKKLQEVNHLTIDGTVGSATVDLLYSDEVKANIIALGEQSDIVKKYQNRLIALGYLSGEADGNFGLSMQNAIRAFQSRNDQVVDGYLGPDTRTVLDSDSAKPFGMRLGEQSSDVQNMQKLLVKYGYLPSDKASGYFGELTKDAVLSFQSTVLLRTVWQEQKLYRFLSPDPQKQSLRIKDPKITEIPEERTGIQGVETAALPEAFLPDLAGRQSPDRPRHLFPLLPRRLALHMYGGLKDRIPLTAPALCTGV